MTRYEGGEFHFVDTYLGRKCHVCKVGSLVDRSAFDIDVNGELCKVLALRTNDRERPGLMSVGYTTCTNSRCVLFTEIGNRKVNDAKYLLKQIRSHAYKRKQRRR